MQEWVDIRFSCLGGLGGWDGLMHGGGWGYVSHGRDGKRIFGMVSGRVFVGYQCRSFLYCHAHTYIAVSQYRDVLYRLSPRPSSLCAWALKPLLVPQPASLLCT